MSDKKTQVADQCKVVVGLAKALIEVHSDLERLFRNDYYAPDDSLVNSIGKHTAHRMEVLGEMLNGMDAVTAEDSWMDTIFEKAHKARWGAK